MRYPNPLGYFGGDLKAKQDAYNPEAERVCRASTDPKCLWVDLRPVWDGHGEYTTDGIHASNAGGTASAEAFWAAMKRNNFFDGNIPVSGGRNLGRNRMKVDNDRLVNINPKPPRNLFASSATKQEDEAQKGAPNSGAARFRSMG
jgi:hypothetical protein